MRPVVQHLTSPTSARVAVVVASIGRPDDIELLIQRLRKQTLAPVRIVLSVESESDLPALALGATDDLEVIFGPRGGCAQRNRAIDALGDCCDYIAIFDDDYVPSQYTLAGIASAFEAHPHVAGLYGTLIADGINSQGISKTDALEMVEEADATGGLQSAPRLLLKSEGLYGCNMAFRYSSLNETRFDEAMPLYAWLEDVDFGARLDGPCFKTDGFCGVHRGEKMGRERNGRMLGYSQIANPLYLRGKGTISRYKAWRIMVRNFLANHGKSLCPEPWIDRKGRAVGNWIAIFHLLTFRLRPDYILNMRKTT